MSPLCIMGQSILLLISTNVKEIVIIFVCLAHTLHAYWPKKASTAYTKQR